MAAARPTCPFLAKPCLEGKCAMWITEWRTDQVNATQEKSEKCGIAFLPIVLTEILQTNRHTTAHAEKLHEASVQGNQIFSQIISMAQQSRARAQIEAHG